MTRPRDKKTSGTITHALEQLMVVINRNIDYVGRNDRAAPTVDELKRIAEVLGHPSDYCDEYQYGWNGMGGSFEDGIYFTHQGLSGVIVHNWPGNPDGINRHMFITLLDYDGVPLGLGHPNNPEDKIILSLISATNAVMADQLNRLEGANENQNPA